MSAFVAKTVTFTTTPTKQVDAEEFDRTVGLITNLGSVLIGFNNTDAVRIADNGRPESFVLPQGSELWGWTDSGSANVGILVTR